MTRTYLFKIPNALTKARWHKGQQVTESCIILSATSAEEARKKHAAYFAHGVKLGVYKCV